MSTKKQEIENVHQSDLYLYFYEASLRDAKTVFECNYIEKHCSISAGQKILDLACGHGRHSFFFARKKHQVVGVDLNERFIEIAKNQNSDPSLNLEFVEGDILEINYEPTFDTALLLYNTLGFFNENDAVEIFRKIGQSLKKGGKAFVDCKNRDHIIKEIKPYEVHEKGNDLMIDRLSFDPMTGTTTNNRTYIKDGKRYEAPFTMYTYHFNDLERMLDGTGLKISKVLGGWKDEVFCSTSRRIVLILEKG